MKKNKIVPFVGYDEYNFSMTLKAVREKLKKKQIAFKQEHWDNKGSTPEVAWDIIRLDTGLSMFFAKNRMFKMYFEGSGTWELENGISTGMLLTKAKEIDDSIKFNEDEEDFESKNGYWIEEDVKSGLIASIAIFIPACLDDDFFYSYKWTN